MFEGVKELWIKLRKGYKLLSIRSQLKYKEQFQPSEADKIEMEIGEMKKVLKTQQEKMEELMNTIKKVTESAEQVKEIEKNAEYLKQQMKKLQEQRLDHEAAKRLDEETKEKIAKDLEKIQSLREEITFHSNSNKIKEFREGMKDTSRADDILKRIKNSGLQNNKKEK